MSSSHLLRIIIAGVVFSGATRICMASIKLLAASPPDIFDRCFGFAFGISAGVVAFAVLDIATRR